MRHFIHTALLSIVLVGPSKAQGRLGPPPGPAFALFRTNPTLPPARLASSIQSTVPHHRDYQWEGVAIGAIIGGALGAYGCRDCMCGYGDTCVGPMAAAAFLVAIPGAFLGGMVGALIPKKSLPSTH
jgi:hypothetical protein